MKSKKPKPQHSAADFDLDILSSDDDMFRWFLLSYLFGKPIQAGVAIQTWKLFIERKLDTPWAILDTSPRALIRLLDEGRYTRYDVTVARALHICMQQLVNDYDGSLLFMLENSENEDEFSKRLQKFYGVGPKTAEIFMRDTEEYFAQRIE